MTHGQTQTVLRVSATTKHDGLCQAHVTWPRLTATFMLHVDGLPLKVSARSRCRFREGLLFPSRSWFINPLRGNTTNRRAGCGRSASPVRREGRPNSIGLPYPYRPSSSFGSTAAAGSGSTSCPAVGRVPDTVCGNTCRSNLAAPDKECTATACGSRYHSNRAGRDRGRTATACSSNRSGSTPYTAASRTARSEARRKAGNTAPRPKRYRPSKSKGTSLQG